MSPEKTPRPVLPAFDALVEGSMAGVYVVQDGRLVYANRRMAEIFGYEPGELMALPSVLDLVAESDRATVQEMIRRRLEGEVEHVRYTWRGVRRDGTIIDVEVLAGRTESNGRPAVSGTLVDVTEQRQRERELAERETRLRSLLEATSDIVFTCDFTGRLTSINPAGLRVAGLTSEDALHRTFIDIVAPQYAERARDLLRNAQTGGGEGTYDVPFLMHGQVTIVELALRVLRRDGVPYEVLGIGRDITERKQKEHALLNLTLVDELTGLYNRRGFLTLAERHLKLAVRKKQGVFLLFCDLDHLKKINDTHGHLEGDRALADAANLLRQTFRSADIIARLGGDEFTVFPLEAADTSAELLMSRLGANISAHNTSAGRPYRLSMSVGIARFEPGSAWTIEQLLEEADRRLYDAKRTRPV
jgi:diguanylate cyclase (GGDEF)-like protein/PAS domain S-box-containing protein